MNSANRTRMERKVLCLGRAQTCMAGFKLRLSTLDQCSLIPKTQSLGLDLCCSGPGCLILSLFPSLPRLPNITGESPQPKGSWKLDVDEGGGGSREEEVFLPWIIFIKCHNGFTALGIQVDKSMKIIIANILPSHFPPPSTPTAPSD